MQIGIEHLILVGSLAFNLFCLLYLNKLKSISKDIEDIKMRLASAVLSRTEIEKIAQREAADLILKHTEDCRIKRRTDNIESIYKRRADDHEQ